VIVAAQGKVVITTLSPNVFEKDSGRTRIFAFVNATFPPSTQTDLDRLPLSEHQKFEIVSKCPGNSKTLIYDGK
jgi:hypothetical protein